jgi:hypothetical protein
LQLPVLVPLELELDLILEPVGNPEFIILKNQTWNWIHGFICVKLEPKLKPRFFEGKIKRRENKTSC